MPQGLKICAALTERKRNKDEKIRVKRKGKPTTERCMNYDNDNFGSLIQKKKKGFGSILYQQRNQMELQAATGLMDGSFFSSFLSFCRYHENYVFRVFKSSLGKINDQGVAGPFQTKNQ